MRAARIGIRDGTCGRLGARIEWRGATSRFRRSSNNCHLETRVGPPAEHHPHIFQSDHIRAVRRLSIHRRGSGIYTVRRALHPRVLSFREYTSDQWGRRYPTRKWVPALPFVPILKQLANPGGIGFYPQSCLGCRRHELSYLDLTLCRPRRPDAISGNYLRCG